MHPQRKGIILAAGHGTRLFPLTHVTSKILLPVYDKPMIYYPLTTLIEAGIQDILLIVSETHLPAFQNLLGDGSSYGVRLSYAIQPVQRGIADAFLIARDYLAGAPSALILGDNIFWGPHVAETIRQAIADSYGAVTFAKPVPDPERFGVAVKDASGHVTDLIEKPKEYVSNLAVTGLYFYDNRVCDFAAQLKPSARGELEITDLNRLYLQDGSLRVVEFQSDDYWFDTGTFESMRIATNEISQLQQKHGLIGAPEWAAYTQGFLNRDTFKEQAQALAKSDYGQNLDALLKNID